MIVVVGDGDAGIRWEHLDVDHALHVPSNAQRDFLGCAPPFGFGSD